MRFMLSIAVSLLWIPNRSLHNGRCYERHNGDTATDDVNRILSALIGMLEKEVAANAKASQQFFSVLARFAETGVAQCKQVPMRCSQLI